MNTETGSGEGGVDGAAATSARASAGGNDVIRPLSDPDDVAVRCEAAIERLKRDNATIVLFTGPDLGFSPVFRGVRGRIAIYNENLRAIAVRQDCVVADLWSLTEIQDPRLWAPDRLHLNALGHHAVARSVLSALNVGNSLQAQIPEPKRDETWRDARTDDLVWARTYLAPWLLRRARRQSSGDDMLPKRPSAASLTGPRA